MIVGIDPGIHGVGISFFDAVTKKLLHADFLQGKKINTKKQYRQGGLQIREIFNKVAVCIGLLEEQHKHTLLVMEWPQIYVPKGEHPYQSIGKAASALWLAAVAGSVCAYWKGDIQLVHPHDWKGNLNTEDAVALRIHRRFSQDEMDRATDCLKHVPASLQHNVIDALGIGLHGAGRRLV